MNKVINVDDEPIRIIYSPKVINEIKPHHVVSFI
jgi:hypothetical protein